MKKTITTLTLAALLALPIAASAGQDEYDDTQSHPLRVAAYVLNPIGLAFEYVLFRPLHALASANPTTEKIFGHADHNESDSKGFDPAFRSY